MSVSHFLSREPKKCRPPPDFAKPSQARPSKPSKGSASEPSSKKSRIVTVEDVDEEDSSARYEKPVEIVEPQDTTFAKPPAIVPSNASTSPKKSTTSLFGASKSSAPKEASKLSNTIIGAEDSEKENPSLPSSSMFAPATKATPVVSGQKASTTPITTNNALSTVQMVHDPKGYAMTMHEANLFVYNLQPASKRNLLQN